MDIEQLKYPIGKFTAPESYSPLEIKQWIDTIEQLPSLLRKETAALNNAQLDTRYREGGWTIRQVVHHLADSHVNSYIRFKLALTEDNPVIKPYLEERWAELPEAKSAPIDLSLAILESIHKRLVMVLRNLTVDQLGRTFVHPQTKEVNPLKKVIALYAWHSTHHLTHITALKKRMGW